MQNKTFYCSLKETNHLKNNYKMYKIEINNNRNKNYKLGIITNNINAKLMTENINFGTNTNVI